MPKLKAIPKIMRKKVIEIHNIGIYTTALLNRNGINIKSHIKN